METEMEIGMEIGNRNGVMNAHCSIPLFNPMHALMTKTISNKSRIAQSML